MHFASIRIVTEQMKPLVAFYEQLTGTQAKWLTEDFAEVKLSSLTLAIASKKTIDAFSAGAARAADNHSAIFEFRVDDVDAEFARLKALVRASVQEPKTQPWGNRSWLFHDPDGNLINFFTPVTPQAIARSQGK